MNTRDEDGRAGAKPRHSLRITRHTPDAARDVRDEVEFHIDMRTQELVDGGVDPAEARQAARQAFGDHLAIESQVRSIAAPEIRKERRTEFVGALLRDVKFAARTLLREPGFTLVACLTLALCIGANAAVFAVVNGVVLRPLPFPDSDRLVTFFNAYPLSGVDRGENSVPDFFDRRELDALDDVALYSQISSTVGEGAAARNVFSMEVSPPFFRVLNVEPALGRGFTDDDGEIGSHRKVIISHGWWQQHFDGAEDVIGREMEASGRISTVVGVMPEDFHFTSWDAELWFPLVVTEESRYSYHNNNYNMVGRLEVGATVEQAQSQVDAVNASLLAEWPTEWRAPLIDSGFQTVVRSYQDDLVRQFRAPLYLLWGSVAFVLLIGCLNVANLILVRSSARLQELSTRFVLGAGRWTIARQLLTEIMVLIAIGGAAGLLLGGWSLRFLGTFEYYQVPRLNEVGVDAQTIGFTLGLAAIVAGIASVAPLMAIGRRDLYGVFRAGSSASPASGGRRAARLLSPRNALVVGQLAIAFVLLCGGALMFTSLVNLWAVDPGFETDNLVAGAIALSGERFADPDTRIAFATRLVTELDALPGVTVAALASQLPFSGAEQSNVFTPEGHEREPSEAVAAHYSTAVTPAYFEAMGIPLLSGRRFDSRDTVDGQLAIIVDQRVARRYWPAGDPIGKRVALDVNSGEDASLLTIVGVVGEVVQNELDDDSPMGAYYLPHTLVAGSFWRIVVRTEVDPATAAASIRERVLDLDSEMPLFWVQTMGDALDERLIPRRIPMMVVMAFAGTALLLATLGIYGVFAYTVARRTQEIGVRVALGGTPGRIYALILRQAAGVIALGLLIGNAGALALNRVIATQLYNVAPTDPAVLITVAAVITAVGLFACLAPARRGARIDPMVALREE